MKYMLLIYGDEQALSDTEREDCYKKSTQLAQELLQTDSIWPGTPCTRQRWPPATTLALTEAT